MQRYQIVEIAFRSAAAHYELRWQDILTEKHYTKPAKQMICFAMAPYLPVNDICELLGLALRTVSTYLREGRRLYKCYGTFYTTVKHIRSQYHNLIRLA